MKFVWGHLVFQESGMFRIVFRVDFQVLLCFPRDAKTPCGCGTRDFSRSSQNRAPYYRDDRCLTKSGQFDQSFEDLTAARMDSS
jgi:hypothetical protein